MDELYGDLENYQFDNIVSELRNENQELKCKLDEYSTSMASLQKDFDKLSADYKKLELNYSSLLKTARAEIERKGQMITNLNIEKDKLVIEAIQRCGRVPNKNKNLTGNNLQAGKPSKEGDSIKQKKDAAVPHANDNKKSGPSSNHHDKKNEQDKTTFSIDSGLNNDGNLKEDEQNIIKHELYKDMEKNKGEFKKYKENLDVLDKGEITSNFQKITLALGPSAKNAADVEENEEKSKNIDFLRGIQENKNETKKGKDNYSDVLSNSVTTNKVNKIRNRRKSMPLMNRSDFKYSSDEDQNDSSTDHRSRRKTPTREDRKYHDKYHYGRYNSERKGPDLSRVGDKHASNYDSSRNVDRKSSSWYRDNDRYKNRDNRDRYESNQRHRRHYSPDRPYSIHGEYNKYRESNDRPHRFDNVRHRTFVSPPSERYNKSRRSREFDGQRFQHDVLLNPIKHKLHEVMEEPVCKRMRRDSLNKPSDKLMFIHDRDDEGRANSASRQLELSYLSLQSPDHVHLENHLPLQHIKEIKDTSDTKLDDPRLTSKKYTVYTHCDKAVLSTVTGRDVNIEAIDTTKWNINKDKNTCERYEMPTPLKEKPPIDDDLVNHIYMAIDNPLSNLSLESGEICLEDELDVVNKEISKTDHDRDIKNVYAKNVQRKDQNMLSKEETVDITDNVIDNACSTSFSKNYRIPKVKKSNIPELLEEDSSINTHNNVKSDNTKQGHKKKSNKEKRVTEKKIQPAIIGYNSSKIFSDVTEMHNGKKHKFVDTKHRKQSPEKRKISSKDTVEGDLELSDETCDYVEVSEPPKSDKGDIAQHGKLGETNQNVIDRFPTDLMTRDPVKVEQAIYKRGIKMSHDDKHFNLINKDHEAHLKESISKTFKEQKSQEIKSKLCDLFGDTSSLITLDDLGIVASTTTKENLNEYTPLFDNTQDAVDLNVEEMEKVQARSSNIKSDVNDPLDGNKHMILEKTKNKNKDEPFLNEENQKFNKVENSLSIKHIFENVNTEPQDSNVVKTVIISTGIQNNCLSSDSTMRDEEHERQPINIERKANDNATTSSALLSIKALATSTPYKPQNEPPFTGPENRNSNNNIAVKDDSNTSSITENICKAAQSNADIPDVRIIVKRRRKAKAAPP